MKRLLTRSLLAIALAVAWLPAALAATLLPNGEQTFLNSNGAPLASGSVYFYIPSTTTAKSTYQDSAATILNANPVVLDAAGRAIIYGVGTYRQVVKDASGVTIWDQLTADTAVGVPTWGGTTSGTGNAQVFAAGSFSSLDGQVVIFRAGFSNSGAMTLQPSGASAISVVRDTVTGPVSTSGGEVIANNVVQVIYDASAGTFHIVNSQLFSGAISTTGAISAGGVLSYTAQITPTALSGNTNDWNPTSLQTAIVIRASASAAYSLTGITAPTTNTSGHLIVVENVGSFNISLTAQDAASAAANRFAIAQAITLAPNQSATFTYDTTTSNWRSASPNQVADYQPFTASGTWTAPKGFSANALVSAICWGGGGAGSSNANGSGGGGGAANQYYGLLGNLTSPVTVTIGAGGVVNSSGAGNTTFGTVFTAFAGGAAAATIGGGGGGTTSVGVGGASTGNGGGLLGGAGGNPGVDSTYGGGGAGNTGSANGGSSIWGGGGGNGGNGAGANNGTAGNSVWGGGGGAGLGTSGTATAGTSVMGGAGGAANVAGTAPAGGGGRNANGARGECRVWTFPG